MRYLVYLLLTALALGLFFCRPATTYRNISEPAKYVGMQTCIGCHEDIHGTFIHTGMGQSWDRATTAKSAASYGDHALVYDSASNLYYFPFWRDSALHIREFRLDGRDTVHLRTERVEWIVGSGQHTNSHVLSFDGYVYQAPITYYTQDGRWDMAPGFAGDNVRFGRLLTSECITCHNHFPKLEPGSINKFSAMPTGIECERCHGPGEIHARERLSGSVVDTSREIDYTIVNPRDLPRDLQLDLCQRCHLQGIAVLNEGMTFYDFQPGMRLSEVFNVFLPRFENSDERFIMASQADRMRLSPCFQASDMTCISCHNPHVSVALSGNVQSNNACAGCHGGAGQTGCSAASTERLTMNDDCSGCHMPKSGSIDIPHVRITDHYISRTNTVSRMDAPATSNGQFLGLEILTKSTADPLEMARGYLALYDKYMAADMVLDSAAMYLERCDSQAQGLLDARVHYHFARHDFEGLLRAVPPQQDTAGMDAWTSYRIGDAWLETGRADRALPWLERSVTELPLQLDFQEKLATALIRTKAFSRAKAILAKVIGENPKRKVALTNLGYLNALEAKYARAEALYDQAIALDPDYVQALVNKAAIRRLSGDEATTRMLLERVLALEPEHAQALAVMATM